MAQQEENKKRRDNTGIRAHQKRISSGQQRSRIIFMAAVAGLILLVLAGKSIAVRIGEKKKAEPKPEASKVTVETGAEEPEAETAEEPAESEETESQAAASVNDTVKSYEWLIREYADQEGISEYVLLLMAIMMVESEGYGDDPMKTAESPYNTRGSMDVDYSIQCGVQELKDMLQQAGCSGPDDIDRIALALQGYNYGNNYVQWALDNYGGYSEDNAWEFSGKMAYQLGWDSYGDPYYVGKVLKYYL